MSCENASTIITTIIAASIAIISEFLPFIPGVEGNGVVHTIVTALKKQFPTGQNTVTVTSNLEPQPPVTVV